MGFFDTIRSRYNILTAKGRMEELEKIKDPEPEEEKTQIQNNCPMQDAK